MDDDIEAIRALIVPDAALEEHIVARHEQWRSLVFRAERLEVRQPDGAPGVRDVVWHNGGAGVAALRDGKLCLVRQWRVALGRVTLEIPAGKIDRGEDPAACAARELAEETGLVAEQLTHVATAAGSPGFTNEVTRIFLAEGLSSHPAHPDPDEFVSVAWVSPATIVAAARAGVLHDAKTIIAAYAALAAGT